MLIIGSVALKIEFEQIGRSLNRTPVDLDLIGYPEEIAAFGERHASSLIKANPRKLTFKIHDKHVELEYGENSTSAELYLDYIFKFRTGRPVRMFDTDMIVAPLEVLHSIKKSHRHSPRHWKKHIDDYLRLDRHFQGADYLDKVTKLRERETREREQLKTPSLNKTAKDFFTDNVSNRTFVHDDIHRVMMHLNKPMYEFIKIDPNLVKCSRDKFDNLDYKHRIQCVLEEAYVIALERCLIPMLFSGGPSTTPDKAFDYAIMRICTTLTSGWFREFAIQNYHQIMFMRDRNYLDKFLEACDTQQIRRVDESQR